MSRLKYLSVHSSLNADLSATPVTVRIFTNVLRSIVTGSPTRLSSVHGANAGANPNVLVVKDKSELISILRLSEDGEDACSTMNTERHCASIDFTVTNIAGVTNTQAVIAQLR